MHYLSPFSLFLKFIISFTGIAAPRFLLRPRIPLCSHIQAWESPYLFNWQIVDQ